MAHIAKEVAVLLEAAGWGFCRSPIQYQFWKRIAGAPGGAFEERGLIVRYRIDDGGRWFEAIDGWGKPYAEIDLREYWGDAAGAIARMAELEQRK